MLIEFQALAILARPTRLESLITISSRKSRCFAADLDYGPGTETAAML
jgi:hypothetical protein